MLPIVYPHDETDFTSRGYGALADCVSCTVTEVLNGEYTLSLKYPKNGIHQEYLEVRNIIVCKPNGTVDRDAFRISKVNRSMKDYITVTAYHLSYDLTGYPVMPTVTEITGRTTDVVNLRDSAPSGTILRELPVGTEFKLLSASTYNDVIWYNIKLLRDGTIGWITGAYSILSSAIGLNETLRVLNDACNGDFTITTDKSSLALFSVDVPSSVRSWFGGKEGSLIDIYGGEWLYNLWTCQLLEHRGTDNNVRISYGVNLAKYVKEITDSVYSEIIPYFAREDGDDLIVGVGNSIGTGATSIQRALYLNVTDKFADVYGKYLRDKLNSWNRGTTGLVSSHTYADISETVVYYGINASYPSSPTQNTTTSPSFTMIENEAVEYRYITLTSNTARIGAAVPIESASKITYEMTWRTAGRMSVIIQYVNSSGSVLSYRSGSVLDANGGSITFTTPSGTNYIVLLFYSDTTTVSAYVQNLRIKAVPSIDDITAQGQAYLSSHPELAGDNITISAELEPLAIEANMGDTVHIIYDDTIVDSRIVKTVWNAITERYTTLEIGTVKQNIAQTIKSLR